MMISNSFGLKAKAKNHIQINTLDDLSMLDEVNQDEILILGAGTNVILSDYYDGTVISVQLKEIEINGNCIAVPTHAHCTDFFLIKLFITPTVVAPKTIKVMIKVGTIC